MTTTSLVSVAFATLVGIAACTPAAPEINAERTAACADRTNNIACDSCCKTVQDSVMVNNVCTCKGASKPDKK